MLELQKLLFFRCIFSLFGFYYGHHKAKNKTVGILNESSHKDKHKHY